MDRRNFAKSRLGSTEKREATIQKNGFNFGVVNVNKGLNIKNISMTKRSKKMKCFPGPPVKFISMKFKIKFTIECNA